jgi:hypothetical protein
MERQYIEGGRRQEGHCVMPDIERTRTGGARPGAAPSGDGDRAPVGRSWFTDVEPPAGTFDRVREDLRSSAVGRLLVELLERHGTELTRLPHQDRRFRLAWHRGGGSMLVRSVLRVLADPDRTLPVTMDAVPLMTCLDRLLAELRRCVSPATMVDLVRVRSALPDLAGLSYQGIVEAFAAASANASPAGGAGGIRPASA